MSRWVYMLGVGLALVALAFVLMDALLWRPGLTEANVRRIREGMKLNEVDAIIHGPGVRVEDHPASRTRTWHGKVRTVYVIYAEDLQTVVRIVCSRHGLTDEPDVLESLRAWLGW
jgi:hypothetical protein